MRSASNASTLALLGALLCQCTFYTCPNTGPGTGPNCDNTANMASAGSAGAAQGGASGVIDDLAPTGDWTSVTANLSSLKSECGNMSYLTAKPDEDMLIAGVAHVGLFSSTDGGQSWTPLGQTAKSAPIENRASSILYDPNDANTYWETGTYTGVGVFKTTDDGTNIAAVGLTHDDFISIDFADPKRKTIVVSGHESDHLLHRSTDGGATWQEIGGNEPDGIGACSYPIVVDPKTFILGCRNYVGSGGIFLSSDAGATWDQVSTESGAAPPLFASDGSIYFASDFTAGIVKSSDQGKSWTNIGKVGVVEPAVGLVQLPDGRLASINGKRVVVSADDGISWHVVSTVLPFTPFGLVYSQPQKAFFAWHFSCDDTSAQLPDDAIMRYDFDYANK